MAGSAPITRTTTPFVQGDDDHRREQWAPFLLKMPERANIVRADEAAFSKNTSKKEEVDRENWIGYRKRGGRSILILARESGLDEKRKYFFPRCLPSTLHYTP